MEHDLSPPAVVPAAPESEPELEVLAPPTGSESSASDRASTTQVATAWILALSVAAISAAGLQYASKQTDYGFFLLALCIVIVFGATWSDVATRRIPNVLTYPAIILGFAFNGVLPFLVERWHLDTAEVFLGASGTLECVQGFGLCAAIGIVSFMARGLGGGDVKLLAAVGAMIGFASVVAVLFNTLLVAAVIGILNWLVGGTLMRRLQGLAHSIYFSIIMRADMREVYRFRPTESPFALSLLIGLISAQFVALHQRIWEVSW